MSGLEVFGAVGTAITLIQMTKNSLGRARRVGRAIEDLRIILGELVEIQDDVDPNLDADLLGQIYLLVQDATELIEDNRTPGRMAMKFLWTNSLDADVQHINTNLTGVCRRLERRARNRARVGYPHTESTASTINASPVLEPLTRFNTHHIPRKRVGSSDSYDTTRDRLRAIESHRRRPSSTPQYLPTVLVLNDTDRVPIREALTLESFSILDHNDPSRVRTIQYESADKAVVVTHEIRYGTIPATDDELAATEVFFLENHLLTLETETEFAIYLLSPLYQFHSAEACNDFLARIRERALVASFLPMEVYKSRLPATPGFFSSVFSGSSRDSILARWKIVRLWERAGGPNSGPVVTMTFHDRSKQPPAFTEWSLNDFRDKALLLKRTKAVELSRYDRDEQFIFLFKTLEEAKAFTAMFERRQRNSSLST